MSRWSAQTTPYARTGLQSGTSPTKMSISKAVSPSFRKQNCMKVVIEIDGTPVVATDVSAITMPDGQKLEASESAPPAELARVAKSLGAVSAGPAKFVKSAGAAEFGAARLTAG